MYNPVSTYRIQFNESFTLKDLDKQHSYLSMLGIGTIYASPLFQAIPGSGHGYDVVNPTLLNPEITSPKDFPGIVKKFQKAGIGWVQDIVPNHMAYHPQNKWLMDVLEKGEYSPYAVFFDFEPGVPGSIQKVMVPFLGVTTEEAFANKEINLQWDNGNFVLAYYDNTYPVNFNSFRKIISRHLMNAPTSIQEIWEKYRLSNPSPTKRFLNTTWEKAKKALQDLSSDKKVALFFQHICQDWNQNTELLRELHLQQNYELCHWQETEKRINFRRFFTVNGLICLRMEHDEVFKKYHSLLAELIDKKLINGLRIDHIDGLNNPNDYLEKLRAFCGKDIYIVAEKILEHDEDFPDFWPIQGNTGYDFLATVNNLLTSVESYKDLHQLYKEVTNIDAKPAELIYQNKKMILTTRMHGEWDNLMGFFNRLELLDYKKENVGTEEIKEALGEFMLACPVYRLYPRVFPLRNQNRKAVESIFQEAQRRNPALKRALEKLAAVILSENKDNEVFNKKLELFFTRLMQFTGPLMAKGVEDTSMYQYNCFIAHNEVGDAINASGITIGQYHEQMLARQHAWPFTMNNTSTHDTKRGEDVRARLNVVSELTDEWSERVHLWMQMNQKLKKRLDSGLLEPSLSVEYFIYQTLSGTFPFDGKADETYKKRIDEYLVKALREAKRKVSWRDPDETYEETVCNFTRAILDTSHDFLEAFVPFQQKIAWRGIVNSLAQLTLKIASPGIPDIYQGTELWDLTLVDPDNRQSVDYGYRYQQLKTMSAHNKKDPESLIQELINNAPDGRIKLWYTQRLLTLRKEHPDLFVHGNYIPITITGPLKGHALAFMRNHGQEWALIIVPLVTAGLSNENEKDYINKFDWKGTQLALPSSAPESWTQVVSGLPTEFNGKENLSLLMRGLLPAIYFGRNDT